MLTSLFTLNASYKMCVFVIIRTLLGYYANDKVSMRQTTTQFQLVQMVSNELMLYADDQ